MVIVSQFLQLSRSKLKFQSEVKKMDHTLIHYEIQTNDVEKLKRFYENIFGWKIIQAHGLIEYW